MAVVRAAGATKTTTMTAMAGGTDNNQLKARRGSGRINGGSGSDDGGNSDGNSTTAIEMAMVTAMTPTLTPSALPSNAQQVVKRSPVINQEGVPL